jgi:NADH-quinone oxidoreductase subunit E
LTCAGAHPTVAAIFAHRLTVTDKQLSPEIEARIEQLWPRFPEGAAGKALTLPVLSMAQEQFGRITTDVIDLVARRLGVTSAHVKGVATFYTMLNKDDVARYHLQICTNIGCMLEGGYEVWDHCKRRLGVQKTRQTSDDGKITLTEVECLAACGYGPVAQIAEKGKPEIPLYFENLSIEKIDQILEALEEGRVPTELGR